METSTQHILAVSCISIIVHCIESLVAFSKSYTVWNTLHFVSLVDFRSQVTLTLHGEKPGNYAAVFLIAMSLAIYGLTGARHRSAAIHAVYILAIVLAATCVLLSFSRLLYFCLFVCILQPVWQWCKQSSLQKRRVIFGIIAAIVFIAIAIFTVRPILRAICETMLFGLHLSQQRSTYGRLSITVAALHLLANMSLYGAGVSNYALRLRQVGMTSPSLLTAHAFNSALEIAIEQGYLGIAASLTVLVGGAAILIPRLQTEQGKVLLGGCAALLVYGFGQTFLVADQATATLIAVFLAVIAGVANEQTQA
jgi:hypothetical protein